MAYRGQVLDNPVSGERFVFHTTADDSDGALLAFDVVISPDGRVPGAHVHPTQEERFEVVSGTVNFRRGLKTVVASAGDVVVVPPGTPHRFTNAGDEDAVMRVQVTPAMNMEELFETAVALAHEGRTFRSGLPKPLELAMFMREFEREVRAPMAATVVRAAIAPIAWLASRRGLDRRYRLADERRDLKRRTALSRGPGATRPASARPSPSRPSSMRDDRRNSGPKGRP